MKKSTIKMKQIISIVTLYFVLTYSGAYSQTLFIENFNFPVIDSLENTGGWTPSGPATPNNVKVIAPGLSYSGYMGSGIGNCVFFSNPGNGDVTLHSFPDQTSGKVYMSFLIRVDSLTATATEGYNICLDAAGPSTSLTNRVFVKKVSSSTFNFGIQKAYDGPVNYSPAVYSKNTTYLVVTSYEFINGVDNNLNKLYVFTSGVPATEPAVPSASNTSGTDNTSIGEIALLNSFITNGLQGSSVKIDGIRIGTTWANTLFQSLNVQLNLKALIQGFYSNVTDKMVKDTATVVLRYNVAPYTIADSSKAVLDSNGNGNFLFSKVGNYAYYYLAVKHRNTIETWSKNPIYFENNLSSLDFSSIPYYAYGNNLILVGSKYCMYNGDVNQDRNVDLNDVVSVNNNASTFTTGYKSTDVNGDNLTDLNDLILTNNNANDFISTLRP